MPEADLAVSDPAMADAVGTARSIATNVARVVSGKHEAIETALVVLIAGGHLLLEDVPGVGKTVLARSIAASIAGTVGRIQFTPDLMPSDITGVAIFNPATREFEIRTGPIFANIVVADEINRAAPRTQSALLEAMAERRVTIDNATRALPDPFCVIATQNPVDMEGTYPLPEAQRDRFMARISIGYPDEAAELTLVQRRERRDPLDAVSAVCTVADIVAARAAAARVHADPAVESYAVGLCRATRDLPEVRLGASPRATLQLIAAAKSRALLHGRGYLSPDDVKAVAVPVLGHRLLLGPGAGSAGSVLASLLATLPVPRPA